MAIRVNRKATIQKAANKLNLDLTNYIIASQQL